MSVRKFLVALAFFVFAFLWIQVDVSAQTEASLATSVEQTADEAYDAVVERDWHLLAAFALALLTLVVRRARSLPDFFKSDRGGPILVGLLAVGVLFVAAALIRRADLVELELYKTIGKIWLEAMGGYVGVKKIFLSHKGEPGDTAGPTTTALMVPV